MSWIEAAKIIVKKLRRDQNVWSGDFASWHLAAQQSKGYSTSTILDKVRSAVLKVKSGEAVYERDSVLFNEIEYSWPLLSALMWVAAKNNGSLKVMDIGGSLGSSYFQNKRFLDPLRDVQWNIVEQENFVAAGRTSIADEKINFFNSVEDCIDKKGKPDILVLACTLPYIEEPYKLLNELGGYSIPHFLMDNTFFNYEDKDRITIQKVPPSIYPASYPCWFLSYKKVLETIAKKYSIVSEHKNDAQIVLDGRSIRYKGFFAQLI